MADQLKNLYTTDFISVLGNIFSGVVNKVDKNQFVNDVLNDIFNGIFHDFELV